MALVPGVRPIIEIGGRVMTDLAGLIRLHFLKAGNTYSTVRSSFATSGYQVTSGKTLKLAAARLHIFTAAAGELITVGYGDNDVGLSTATVPTNATYPAGTFYAGALTSGATAGNYDIPMADLPIPATKYPFIGFMTGQVAGFLLGYET